jgi:hypothetical protein
LQQEFGANSDRDDVRYHYLTTPFMARYVRFHPLEWHRHISMRAGLLGCPYKGAPCNFNLAILLIRAPNRAVSSRVAQNARAMFSGIVPPIKRAHK